MWTWIRQGGFRDVEELIIPVIQGIFGVTCVHCKEQVSHHVLPLCVDCSTEIPQSIRPLRFESEYLKRVWCMGPYRSVLGSVIRCSKYAGRRSIFERLGCVLAGASLDLPEIDAVVSVPLPMSRKLKRGFNQSTILARCVAQFLDVSQYEILLRIDQQEQAGKSQPERRHQLTGRFEVRPHFNKDTIPKKVLIVDDVITTGSTAESCALELLNVGVKEVYVLALVSG